MSSIDLGLKTARGTRRRWKPQSMAADWRATSSNASSPSRLGRSLIGATRSAEDCAHAPFAELLANSALAAASFTNERRVVWLVSAGFWSTTEHRCHNDARFEL